jgi:hypothetical protein
MCADDCTAKSTILNAQIESHRSSMCGLKVMKFRNSRFGTEAPQTTEDFLWMEPVLLTLRSVFLWNTPIWKQQQ